MDTKLVVRWKFAGKSWTEVFWRQQIDLQSTLDAFDDIKTQALACRHPDCVLQGITASNAANPREAKPKRYNLKAPGVANATPDITNTAARLALNCAAGKSRKLWLRGLNDAWTIRDDAGNDTPAGALLTRLNNYIAGLSSHLFAIRYAADTTTNPWISAGAALRHSVGGRFWLRINTAADMTGFAGSMVYLSGFPQTCLGGAKGVFQCIAAGDGYIVVNYPWTLPDITLTLVGARFRKYAYLYSQITDGQFEILTTHDTGGSIDRPRGRRKGLRIRQSLPVAG